MMMRKCVRAMLIASGAAASAAVIQIAPAAAVDPAVVKCSQEGSYEKFQQCIKTEQDADAKIAALKREQREAENKCRRNKDREACSKADDLEFEIRELER
ncbi:hypothetical protein [Nocardia brasiliensis]|uniref:hypothetical protein n=1 Tax=Nocardia brasiliensis TaxID=37326 RepID=UPI00366E042F